MFVLTLQSSEADFPDVTNLIRCIIINIPVEITASIFKITKKTLRFHHEFWPFKDEAQTALFKDPVRTAL
jgi:hypothetical protein